MVIMIHNLNRLLPLWKIFVSKYFTPLPFTPRNHAYKLRFLSSSYGFLCLTVPWIAQGGTPVPGFLRKIWTAASDQDYQWATSSPYLARIDLWSLFVALRFDSVLRITAHEFVQAIVYRDLSRLSLAEFFPSYRSQRFSCTFDYRDFFFAAVRHV